MTGRVIVDPYALLDRREANAAGFAYATLGRAVATAEPQDA